METINTKRKSIKVSNTVYLLLNKEKQSHESYNDLMIRLLNKPNEQAIMSKVETKIASEIADLRRGYR